MTTNETVTNREKTGTALLSVLAIIFLTLVKAAWLF